MTWRIVTSNYPLLTVNRPLRTHSSDNHGDESRRDLPVEAVLGDVLQALETSGTCVLVAPTGAGKTTRLPPALVDAGMGPVVILEPRRLAARSAAKRVAKERGVKLGREVGYRVRFDSVAGKDTKITFVTEGIFIRRLQEDPFLEGIGCVVLDEFHERSLDLDLALALVYRVQQEVRPELKLVVTSATLDAPLLSRYLGDAPIVRSEGRLFTVETEYFPQLAKERGAEHVARAVGRALETSPGDVLVFLPGVGEIRRAHTALEGLARTKTLEVLELYGDLAAEAQDAVLEGNTRRKVILATNIAESSVTVPGVTVVVDTGLARSLKHDPAVGLDRLVLGRISLASAEQRKGRAGREEAGHCIRLWSAAEQRALATFDEPEVRRADLTATLLQLLAWGERDMETFPWLEHPKPEALARAWEVARVLGAVEGQALTDLGRTLVRFPTQPRLARLLVAGHAAGELYRCALAAALLGERDPWRRDAPPRHTESDVLERVRALENFASRGARSSQDLQANGARTCLRVADQLERVAINALGREPRSKGHSDDTVLRALLAAFPDRLSRRRPEDNTRAVMAGGRGLRFSNRSGFDEGELFLAIELDAGQGEAYVQQASLVEREWINGGRTRTELACVFDSERRRVIGRKRVLLGELILEEVDAPAEDRGELERVLVKAAAGDLARALDLARPEVVDLRARVAFLQRWMPELGLHAFDDKILGECLPLIVPGCRSFADLARAPLVEVLLGQLTHQQSEALAREAPQRLPVPSGSHIRVDYSSIEQPVLAARIQELFGLTETPRIAGNRVGVLLHLLAPNGRPQQVTNDLASFWSGTYFDVRKDLRRRYPRHAWPDDPTTAEAVKRPRRRH
ncbi:MAG: ATP-dependent helicase HrpB [Planctomycetota bacterium]